MLLPLFRVKPVKGERRLAVGNKPKRTKDREDVSPKTIVEPGSGSGGVVVAEEDPRITWTFALEDLTSAAQGLKAGVAARAAPDTPRFPVYAGRSVIGFCPRGVSAEMRAALRAGGGVLLGQVTRVDLRTKRVVVEISLHGS
ncbi:MAG TPA: hypothetical protein VGC93_09075 [Thermoanaerobaculia bacterium]